MTLLPGALIAVAAAAANEFASDIVSFTPAVVDCLRQSPRMTLAQALSETSKQVLTNRSDQQHPRVIVRPRRGAAPGESVKRWALYIANKTYENNPGGSNQIESLKNPANQTRALKALLTQRGWQTWGAPQQGVRYAKKAREIEALFRAVVESSILESGESLLLFYSGHGLPQGIVGTGYNYDESEIVSYQRLVDDSTLARARGIDVLLLLDSCHAGALIDLLRKAQLDELSPLVENTRLKSLFLKVLKLCELQQQTRQRPSGIILKAGPQSARKDWQGQLPTLLSSTFNTLSALEKESRGQGGFGRVAQATQAARKRIVVHLGLPEKQRTHSKIARQTYADLDDLLDDVLNEALLLIESSLPE